MRQIRTQTQLGQCAIINLKWAQLQAGRRNIILTSDDTIEYIENRWVIQLHNQLQDMKGKLLLHQMDDSILQRENDAFLMDGFATMKYHTNTMRKLNHCRLYLKVERLSDIATNDGKKLQGRYINGSMRNPYTNKQWPIQQKPDAKTWKLWKHALETTFLAGNTLAKPLQRWIHEDGCYMKRCDEDMIMYTTLNGREVNSTVHITRTTVKSQMNWKE